MPSSKVHASIAIFVGDPIDLQQYRHTALHFRFEDGQPSETTHVTGTQGGYVVECQESYNPAGSEEFAKWVVVGWLDDRPTREQIISYARQTRPNNADSEYNCHSWVTDTLRGYRDRGSISSETYSRSVDEMIAATMEAEDDEF